MVNATALVMGGDVYVSTNAVLAICYDAQSGQERWRTDVGDSSIFPVSRFRDRIMVRSRESLYLIKRQSGMIERQWNWPGHKIDHAEVTGDRIIVLTSTFDENRPYPQASKSGRLRILDGDHQIHDIEESSGPWFAMRYDAGMNVLFESTGFGIGMIDPESGRRTHFIESELGLMMRGAPIGSDSGWYVCADGFRMEVDDDGQMCRDDKGIPIRTRFGALVKLRFP